MFLRIFFLFFLLGAHFLPAYCGQEAVNTEGSVVYDTICADTYRLSGRTPAGGQTGYWDYPAGITITAIHDPEAVASGFAHGQSYRFIWLITEDELPVEADTVILTYLTTSAADAGSDQCLVIAYPHQPVDAMLKGNPPTSGEIVSWQVIQSSVLTSESFEDSTGVNTMVYGAGPGMHMLSYTITNNATGCKTVDTTILRVIGEAAIKPYSSCITILSAQPDTTITLEGALPLGGAVSNWTNAGTLLPQIIQPDQPVTDITLSEHGTYLIRYFSRSGSCVDSSEIRLTLITRPETSGDTCLVIQDSLLLENMALKPGEGSRWRPETGEIHTDEYGNVFYRNFLTGSQKLFYEVWDQNQFCLSADSFEITGISRPLPKEDTCLVLEPGHLFQELMLNHFNYDVLREKVTVYSIEGDSSVGMGNNLSLRLHAGVHHFVSVIENLQTQCSISDTFKITVLNKAVAGPDQCLKDAVMAELNAVYNFTISDETGAWYSPLPLIFAESDKPETAVQGFSGGVYPVYWIVSNGQCADSSLMYISVISSARTAEDTCIHEAYAVLRATDIDRSYQSGLWKSVSVNQVIDDTSSAVATASNLKWGIHTFIWQVQDTIGFCESLDTLSITRFSLPDAGEDQCITTISGTTEISLAPAALKAGEYGFWSNADSAAVSLGNSAIQDLPLGIHTFYRNTGHHVSGCYASDSVNIRVITASNAGPDLCLAEPVVSFKLAASHINESAGETGLWKNTQNLSFSSYSDPDAEILEPASGAYTLWWHIGNDGCVDSSGVRVSILSPPRTAPDVCVSMAGADTVRLRALPFDPSYQSGKWYTNVNNVSIADTQNIVSEIYGLNVGLSRFYWQLTDTLGVCVFTDSLDINVASAPQAYADRCHVLGNQPVALSGNSFVAQLEQGFWSASVDGLLQDSLLINPKLMPEPGRYTFAWNIKNTASGCTQSDTVEIVVVSQASIQADAKYPLCLGADMPYELRADTVWQSKGENGNWKEITDGNQPGLLFADMTGSVSGVEILRKGIHKVQWTIENAGCSSADSIHLSVTSEPDAGEDQCVPYDNGTDTEVFLKAGNIVDTVESGRWQILPGSSSYFVSTFQEPDAVQTSVRGVLKGVDRFQWTITDSNGNCAKSDTVKIALITVPDAGPDLCKVIQAGEERITVQLLGNIPVANNEKGQWLSGPSALVGDSAHGNTSVTLPRGVSRLVWSIRNELVPSCAVFDTVVIRAISQAVVGETQCLSTPVVNTFLKGSSYNGNAGEAGLWSKETVSSQAVIENPVNPESKLSNLKTGVHRFKWVISNDGCKDSASATIALITRPITGDNQCLSYEDGNSRVTLLANPATPAEVSTWLPADHSIAGVSLNPTGNMCELNVFSKGAYTIYYRISDSASVCPALRDSVQVTLLTKPKIEPVVCEIIPAGETGKDIPLITENTLSVQEEGMWHAIPGLTFNGTASPNTMAGNVPAGTYRVYWSVHNKLDAACSLKDSIVMRVISAASTEDDICIIKPVENTILQANPPLTGRGETGNWRLVSDPHQIQFDPNIAQSTVIRLPVGISVFRWYISNGACRDSSDVRVSVQTKANAGGDVAVCGDQTMLNALQVAVNEAGIWNILNEESQEIAEVDVFNTSVSGLKPGINRFVWTVSNAICSNSDTVEIINNQPTKVNISTQDQESCFTANLLVGNKAANEISTARSLWQIMSEPAENSPKAVINSPGADSTLVRNLNAPGDYMFVYKIFNANCDTIADTVTIRRNESLYNFVAGPAQACVTDTIELMGQAVPLDGEGDWILAGGAGIFENRFSNVTRVYGLGVKQNLFYWRLKRGECQNYQSLTIDGYDRPSEAFIFNENEQLCETDTITLRAQRPEIGQCSWEVVSGSAELESPESHITRVVNLALGTTRFRWTCTNGPCDTSYAEVTMQRFKKETDAVAGRDTMLCGNAMTLEAVKPETGTGHWSLLSGSLDIDQMYNAHTSVYNISYGENVLRWYVENGPCSSADTLVIIAEERVDEARTGNDLFLCEQSKINIYAQMPDLGRGYWRALSGNDLESPQENMTQVLNLPPDTSYYVWTVEKGFCQSADTLKIYNYLRPSPASAGKDRHIYSEEVLLQADEIAVGQGKWQALNPEIELADPASHVTMAYNLPPGISSFVWTVSNGICPVSADTLEIVRDNFKIPNAFSPNGDGKNDTFEVKGLELFSPAKITIFNRWGEEIFHANDYKNDWEGKNMNGKDLAPDTYFYVLTLNNGKSYQGYVILKR